MRLGYLVSEAVVFDSGVGAKLRSQTAAWRAAGHDTFLAVGSRPSTDPVSRQRWQDHGVATSVLSEAGNAALAEFSRHRAGLELAWQLRSWRPDAAYVRFGPYHLGEELILRSGCPVVLEFNTDDVAEYRDRAPLYWYHRATRARMLRAAVLAFAPTNAIAAAMSRDLRCEVLVLPNGADTSGVAVLPPNAGPPAIAFMAGSGSARQGVDKVLRLAALLEDVQFHLIGPLPALAEAPNVTFHGLLSVAQYGTVLGRCDVALGTLALHRIGMDEAAPLKVRECLAHGLPVVIAHRDPDAHLFDRWALRIPNTEDNVEACARGIHEFVHRMHGTRVPSRVRVLLGHDAKEHHRLDAIETVLSGEPRSTSSR